MKRDTVEGGARDKQLDELRKRLKQKDGLLEEQAKQLVQKDEQLAQKHHEVAALRRRLTELTAKAATARRTGSPMLVPSPASLAPAVVAGAAPRRAGDLAAAVVLIVANDYPGQPEGVGLPAVESEATDYGRMVADAGGTPTTLRNASVLEFREALGTHHPDVLIFCGHGDVQLGDEQALAFMHRERERVELERDETIVDILCKHAEESEAAAAASGGREASAQLQLILLNGCCTHRLGLLLLARKPSGLRHVVCWRTISADAAARGFGTAYVQRRLRRRRQLRRESACAAFEGAKEDVRLRRVDSTLDGRIQTTVPMFAFEDPNDSSKVDPRTRQLNDGSGAIAAGIPVLVDLYQEERREKDAKFNDSLPPLLKHWVGDVPSGTPEIQQLRERLDTLDVSVAEGDSRAMEDCARLAAVVVPKICTTATPFTTLARLKELNAIVEAGNKLFRGVYDGMHAQVRNNECYGAFCSELGAVKVDTSRFPQRTGSLSELYHDAVLALPVFEGVLADIVRESGAGAKMRVVPLKHVFRVLQKHAMRVDGGAPHECETACDIVRGSIVCGSMTDLLTVLRTMLRMQQEGKIAVVRRKNRFQAPTAAGYADTVVNIVCLDGHGQRKFSIM
eukprot:g3172.t1